MRESGDLAVPGPIVRLDAVEMRYTTASGQEVPALHHIDLAVDAGEFVCVIGPSGCGKSTLLQIAGGMTTPLSGEVFLHGTPLDGPRPDAIAFVFQDYALFPWLTVRANIELALRFHGVPSKQRRHVAEEYLELVELSAFGASYPAELSGGVQQRVAVARALATKPQLLLMDEPFGALDNQTRMLMGYELLHLIEATGTSVLFVTHSLSEAVFLGDRVAVLSARPGRIKAIIEVAQKRPREQEFTTSHVFHELRTRLFGLLRDENRTPAGSPAANTGTAR